MTKIILKSIIIMGYCSSINAADWAHPPPKPPRAYEVIPEYTFQGAYYNYGIPGYRTCISGCSKEYLQEIYEYNQRLKKGRKKALGK